MTRRVVSVLRRASAALRPVEPALEANAYAVAEDIELTVLLRGEAVELAVAGGLVRPGELAGVPLPPAASGQDLRGLVESGIGVLVAQEDLTSRGLGSAALVAGARPVTGGQAAALLRSADAVIAW